MADNEKKSGGGLMGIVKPIAIVAVLVVVEMVAAAVMIPSAEQTEDLARELARASKGEETVFSDLEDPNSLDEIEQTTEVELVAENITRFDPERDTVLNIDFVVFGVVQVDEEEEFLLEFEAHRGRIKEQIIFTLHNAKASELASSGLGLIKRQILEKTNRTLGRPLLREVGFTKINFVER